MSLENLPGTDDQFAALRAALSGGDAARTPEIVAIFQQIKNLRESDRSLRSIRRNLELALLDAVGNVAMLALCGLGWRAAGREAAPATST